MTLVPTPGSFGTFYNAPCLNSGGCVALDQSLVLLIFIVALIVNLALLLLILLAVRADLRRNRSIGERVSASGDYLAAMPESSSIRPSTAGLAPNLVVAAPAPSTAPGTLAPTSSTSFPAMATTIDRAPADSEPPSPPSGRSMTPPYSEPQAESTIPPFAHGDDGPEPGEDPNDGTLIDSATGLATRRAWNEVFHHEEHRLARYGRAVTLMVAELDGLDSLAERLGQSAADRLIPPVAAAMKRNARGSDFVARTGHQRFVALLPETDEVAAIHYVERVRSACDMWLEAGGLSIRLVVGWAQPVAGGHLADALRLADDRMNADRRRVRAASGHASTEVFIHDEESSRPVM
jgi:diguanylate cyclase (GGDEF)-like protein